MSKITRTASIFRFAKKSKQEEATPSDKIETLKKFKSLLDMDRVVKASLALEGLLDPSDVRIEDDLVGIKRSKEKVAAAGGTYDTDKTSLDLALGVNGLRDTEIPADIVAETPDVDADSPDELELILVNFIDDLTHNIEGAVLASIKKRDKSMAHKTVGAVHSFANSKEVIDLIKTTIADASIGTDKKELAKKSEMISKTVFSKVTKLKGFSELFDTNAEQTKSTGISSESFDKLRKYIQFTVTKKRSALIGSEVEEFSSWLDSHLTALEKVYFSKTNNTELYALLKELGDDASSELFGLLDSDSLSIEDAFGTDDDSGDATEKGTRITRSWNNYLDINLINLRESEPANFQKLVRYVRSKYKDGEAVRQALRAGNIDKAALLVEKHFPNPFFYRSGGLSSEAALATDTSTYSEDVSKSTNRNQGFVGTRGRLFKSPVDAKKSKASSEGRLGKMIEKNQKITPFKWLYLIPDYHTMASIEELQHSTSVLRYTPFLSPLNMAELSEVAKNDSGEVVDRFGKDIKSNKEVLYGFLKWAVDRWVSSSVSNSISMGSEEITDEFLANTMTELNYSSEDFGMISLIEDAKEQLKSRPASSDRYRNISKLAETLEGYVENNTNKVGTYERMVVDLKKSATFEDILNKSFNPEQLLQAKEIREVFLSLMTSAAGLKMKPKELKNSISDITTKFLTNLLENMLPTVIKGRTDTQVVAMCFEHLHNLKEVNDQVEKVKADYNKLINSSVRTLKDVDKINEFLDLALKSSFVVGKIKNSDIASIYKIALSNRVTADPALLIGAVAEVASVITVTKEDLTESAKEIELFLLFAAALGNVKPEAAFLAKIKSPEYIQRLQTFIETSFKKSLEDGVLSNGESVARVVLGVRNYDAMLEEHGDKLEKAAKLALKKEAFKSYNTITGQQLARLVDTAAHGDPYRAMKVITNELMDNCLATYTKYILSSKKASTLSSVNGVKYLLLHNGMTKDIARTAGLFPKLSLDVLATTSKNIKGNV